MSLAQAQANFENKGGDDDAEPVYNGLASPWATAEEEWRPGFSQVSRSSRRELKRNECAAAPPHTRAACAVSRPPSRRACPDTQTM